MIKAEMASQIAKEVGITVFQATQAVEMIANCVAWELQQSGKSRIPHLGAFRVYHTAPRKVATEFGGPRTKVVPSRRVIKFKVAPGFNASVSA